MSDALLTVSGLGVELVRDTVRRPLVEDVTLEVGPGDSGGPLITPDGSVAGVAFGIAPDRAETAYAIPTALLQGLVEQVSAEPLASGACRGE